MTTKMLDTISNLSEEKEVNPRSAFYKKPIKGNNYKQEVDYIDTPQDIRRQRLLEIQKRNRDAAFNAGRDLVNDVFNLDNEEEDEMEFESCDRTFTALKRHKCYANRLMLSEWMLEVPQDFSNKWIMVPCPQGKRTLLVAYKGITKAYNRRGFRLGIFPSVLPGGNSEEHRGRCTILDCIWIKEQKTYFVLDVLAWSNQSLLNCDTEFRFFWLQSKLQEIEELKERGSQRNAYPILRLPNISCDCDLESALINLPPLPPLDGLLFYHRNGQYTKGYTPLVTWLKTFMLPEVLNVCVPPSLDETPDGYINMEHYLLSIKAEKQIKTSSRNLMEIVDQDVE